MEARDYEESVRDSIKLIKLYEMETDSISVSDDELFEAFKKQNEKVQVSYALISAKPFENQVSSTKEEELEYYTINKHEFLKPKMVNVDYISLPFPEEKPEPNQKNDEDITDNNTEDTSEADTELVKEEIRDNSISIYNDLLINPNMNEVAKQNQVDVQTSGPFSVEKPNLKLGWTFQMFKQIFEMTLGDISEPLETDKGVFLIKIIEKKEAYVPEYNETTEEVQQSVLKQKALAQAKIKAEELLSQINDNLSKTKIKDFPQAAKDVGVTIYQTPIFSRGQYLPIVGLSKEFQDEAFKLNEEMTISKIVETEKGFCFLHLDEYKPAEQKIFELEKNIIAQQLVVEKKMKKFTRFLSDLRVEAHLEDNISALREQQGQI